MPRSIAVEQDVVCFPRWIKKAQKRRVNPDTSVRFPQFWPPALPKVAMALAEASDIESSFLFRCGYNIRNATACQHCILRKFPKAKNGVLTDDQSIGWKNAKKWLNSQKVGEFKDMKITDLSLWGLQHIRISGRLHKGYRPMLYVTIEALRSLPSVALSSLWQEHYTKTCWCLKALNLKILCFLKSNFNQLYWIRAKKIKKTCILVGKLIL